MSIAVRTSATLFDRLKLRLRASSAITALLCLMPCVMTHAAETKKITPKSSTSSIAPIKTIHWPDITLGFKDGLTWLRETTVYGLLPKHAANEGLNGNYGSALQFDTERELFESIHQDEYGDYSKVSPAQRSGLKIGRNTKFQWNLERYWTVKDQQEIAVKLGLHYDFR